MRPKEVGHFGLADTKKKRGRGRDASQHKLPKKLKWLLGEVLNTNFRFGGSFR